MGNLVATIKRFLSNKNTVTILGVLAGIGVLIYGYNYRVSHAISTISIPYARSTITATNEITEDQISYIEVLNDSIKNNKNIITTQAQLISQTETYCVRYGTSIPEGAFFYAEQVCPCKEVPNNILKNMPDGYKPVELPVDIHSTYGNSLYPGDYIDLYVRMKDPTTNIVRFGKFIEKIQIADVRNSSGVSVFLTANQTSEPSSLLFALKEEYFTLLRKATIANEVAGAQIEIIPIPGNATYTSSPGEMSITSEYIRNEINSYVDDIVQDTE